MFTAFAAATGVKFDFYLVPNSLSYDRQISQMVSELGITRFVEGLNEADRNVVAQSYHGITGIPALMALQQALYSAVAAAGTTPVIAPSYGILADYATAFNDAALSSYGNIHEYFGTGNPPGGASGGIAALLATAAQPSGSNPIIATEAGYYTASTPGTGSAQFLSDAVDQTVQAKYDLTILFDNWKDGVPVTYLYELLDEAADPNDTNFADHYGVFNANGTPKLAATALHNLTTILADNGTPRNGDTLGYQVTGLPTTGQSLLLEKSTGAFDLTLWNDVRLWSATSPTEVNVTLPPITVNFGQIVQSVTEYDPLTGTGAVATWTNVSTVNIGLPDHPVVFEVVTYPAGQLSLSSYITPTSLSGGQSSGNLWSTIMANVVETNPNWTSGVTIASVGTTGTTGTVAFNASSQVLTYTGAAYNAFAPADSFTYTVADGHGGTVTGTVAMTELPATNTTYGTTTGATYTAPSASWTMISLTTGQTLNGSSAGGDTFIANVDTSIHAAGSGNTIIGGNGNFYAGAGTSNAHVTLGNGNNTVIAYGTGDVISLGNGNNTIWKPAGSATITTGNGNETINVGGTNNTISVGTGTSTINAGIDGTPAGYESVTAVGGTNTITLGGAYDTVHLLGGTGNLVNTNGGYATITLDAGSTTVGATGVGNTVTARSGTNTINVGGSTNVVNGGSGSDTIWAGGDYDVVNAGTGMQTITSAGHHGTFNLTHGTDTFTDNGGFQHTRARRGRRRRPGEGQRDQPRRHVRPAASASGNELERQPVDAVQLPRCPRRGRHLNHLAQPDWQHDGWDARYRGAEQLR